MPGLVGFAGDYSEDEARMLLKDMASALKGEDWYQLDLHHGQGFGLGRVSLGISNPEPQPIWNEDGTLAVVMEGEIFDYQNLKQHLVNRGHRFQVNNDAEFVLHLYEEFGEGFAIKLNGAFAVAIWDKAANRLLLANDRLGLHPLYYAQRNGSLMFASGVRALLADPALARHVDLMAVSQFLSFEYVLGDRTLLREVQMLPPASLLTFCNGQLTIRSYWRLQFDDTYPLRSQESYFEEFIYLMRQAVARQIRNRLPAGILLSGGLDSRMILAFLCENAGPPYTFTFGIPGCDDARLARELAAQAGTEHQFFELRPDYLLDVGEVGVELTDGLESCVHMHTLANLQAQAELVSVIYKGYMGDALMGGHLDLQLWANYDEDTLSRLLFDQACILFDQTEQSDLFTEDSRSNMASTVFETFQAALAESKATLVANRQNHFDLCQRQRRFTLNGVELVRSQVVVRTPFCDKDLVEFMLTVPPFLRFDRPLMVQALATTSHDLAKVPYEGTGLPLVACARDLRIRIDRQVRWRLRSAGLKSVSAPSRRPYANYHDWMRTDLRGWVQDTLLSRRALGRGYFKPDYIRTLVAEHMAGANHANKLGVLLTLELWNREFVD
jgi:asparagine synthase (glutamine-hydrolysing)